jgi:hypothetical protein
MTITAVTSLLHFLLGIITVNFWLQLPAAQLTCRQGHGMLGEALSKPAPKP